MAEIRIFTDQKEFWKYARQAFLPPQKTAKKNFRLAACGGSAAEILNEIPKNIGKIEIWQTDERFVSHDHPDSNAKLLRKKISNFVKQYETPVKEQFFSILPTIEKSMETYENKLKQAILKNRFDDYFFDLAVLGVGPDGHIASLFPKNSALDSLKLVEHTQTKNFAVKDRLTLTFRALEKSRKILVLMLGKAKKEVFETITNPKTDFHESPARRLLDFPQTEILFFDGELSA